MVFGTVAIVDRIVVGVLGEGVSIGNGEEVVDDIFVIMMCG